MAGRCAISVWLLLVSTSRPAWTNVLPPSGLRNDIAAALTAREGCLDADAASPVSESVAACRGDWQGHVANASLCAAGFSVCSWKDRRLLRQVQWTTATQLDGCFAYNAAQDADECLPCKEDDPGSDDMAGIGRNCPHTNVGQSGCLLDGRIDASCCTDSLQHKGCRYVDKLTTGVLCCKRPEPEMLQRDDAPKLTDVLATRKSCTVGEKLRLQCPVTGTDPLSLSNGSNTKLIWHQNGKPKPSVKTASWTINFANPSDSGVYSCQNELTSVTSFINVTVYGVPSTACADGTSEGFHDSDGVRGCAGIWKGHVRKASQSLCGKGWRVCTPKDRTLLDEIDSKYLTRFGGCFAYNAAHVGQRCRKCKNRLAMAAIGRDCPTNEKVAEDGVRSPSTCYSNRRIGAYSSKLGTERLIAGCSYRSDQSLTGVLCCQRPRHGHFAQNKNDTETDSETVKNKCIPPCQNGGSCENGQCTCAKGYSGVACQQVSCIHRCLNGGVCLQEQCVCSLPYYGENCQHRLQMLGDSPNNSAINNNRLEDNMRKKRRRTAPILTQLSAEDAAV